MRGYRSACLCCPQRELRLAAQQDRLSQKLAATQHSLAQSLQASAVLREALQQSVALLQADGRQEASGGLLLEPRPETACPRSLEQRAHAVVLRVSAALAAQPDEDSSDVQVSSLEHPSLSEPPSEPLSTAPTGS